MQIDPRAECWSHYAPSRSASIHATITRNESPFPGRSHDEAHSEAWLAAHVGRRLPGMHLQPEPAAVNPITHLLTSWSLAEASTLGPRDRAIIAWLGVAPDIDGLGAVVDISARLIGVTDPELFGRFHHVLLHGALGAIVLPAIGVAFAQRRRAVFLWGAVVVHVHLFADLLGARGPDVDDIWPIHYFAPFSDAGTFAWTGQWPLNAWPNIVFTLVLLAFAFARAATSGRSPVSLFSTRAHEAFVATVQHRWRQQR